MRVFNNWTNDKEVTKYLMWEPQKNKNVMCYLGCNSVGLTDILDIDKIGIISKSGDKTWKENVFQLLFIFFY